MTLSELYQARVLELNRTPLNYGELTGATHAARGVDALCGDDLLIQLRVNASGTIACARWSGEACAITSASASMLTEWLIGRDQDALDRGFAEFLNGLKQRSGSDEPNQLGELTMLWAVRDFPSRVNNALLPWRTARNALNTGSA